MPHLLELPRELRDELIDPILLSHKHCPYLRTYGRSSFHFVENFTFPKPHPEFGLYTSNHQLRAETLQRAHFLGVGLHHAIHLTVYDSSFDYGAT
jgi:hypothetical protein